MHFTLHRLMPLQETKSTSVMSMESDEYNEVITDWTFHWCCFVLQVGWKCWPEWE